MTSDGRDLRFPGFNVVAQGRLIALAEFRPPGAEFAYELAARPPGVRVIGVTRDRTGLWLTDEWRHESGGRDIRLPGGKIADSLGTYLDDIAAGRAPDEQDIVAAAQREFGEEVGLELLDPSVLAMVPCGATVLWDLYYVTGTAADTRPRQALERGEDVKPLEVSFPAALELARTVMEEARSALQLMRFCQERLAASE